MHTYVFTWTIYTKPNIYHSSLSPPSGALQCSKLADHISQVVRSTRAPGSNPACLLESIRCRLPTKPECLWSASRERRYRRCRSGGRCRRRFAQSSLGFYNHYTPCYSHRRIHYCRISHRLRLLAGIRWSESKSRLFSQLSEASIRPRSGDSVVPKLVE